MLNRDTQGNSVVITSNRFRDVCRIDLLNRNGALEWIRYRFACNTFFAAISPCDSFESHTVRTAVGFVVVWPDNEKRDVKVKKRKRKNERKIQKGFCIRLIKHCRDGSVIFSWPFPLRSPVLLLFFSVRGTRITHVPRASPGPIFAVTEAVITSSFGYGTATCTHERKWPEQSVFVFSPSERWHRLCDSTQCLVGFSVRFHDCTTHSSYVPVVWIWIQNS